MDTRKHFEMGQELVRLAKEAGLRVESRSTVARGNRYRLLTTGGIWLVNDATLEDTVQFLRRRVTGFEAMMSSDGYDDAKPTMPLEAGLAEKARKEAESHLFRLAKPLRVFAMKDIKELLKKVEPMLDYAAQSGDDEGNRMIIRRQAKVIHSLLAAVEGLHAVVADLSNKVENL